MRDNDTTILRMFADYLRAEEKHATIPNAENETCAASFLTSTIIGFESRIDDILLSIDGAIIQYKVESNPLVRLAISRDILKKYLDVQITLHSFADLFEDIRSFKDIHSSDDNTRRLQHGILEMESKPQSFLFAQCNCSGEFYYHRRYVSFSDIETYTKKIGKYADVLVRDLFVTPAATDDSIATN